MARLSTHVLDTAHGRPAAGVVVELYLLSGTDRQPLTTAVTNADGRTDRPLIAEGPLEVGVYELVFKAGDYFQHGGVALTSPPFLADVVIRFGVSDPDASYHVPLLLSPFGYTTYRGS